MQSYAAKNMLFSETYSEISSQSAFWLSVRCVTVGTEPAEINKISVHSLQRHRRVCVPTYNGNREYFLQETVSFKPNTSPFFMMAGPSRQFSIFDR